MELPEKYEDPKQTTTSHPPSTDTTDAEASTSSPKSPPEKQGSQESTKNTDSGISPDQSEPISSDDSENRLKGPDEMEVETRGEPKEGPESTRPSQTSASNLFIKFPPPGLVELLPQQADQQNQPELVQIPAEPEALLAPYNFRHDVPEIPDMTRHEWIYSNRLMECPTCGILYRDEVLFYIHMQAHDPDEQLRCVCNIHHEDVHDFNIHIFVDVHHLRDQHPAPPPPPLSPTQDHGHQPGNPDLSPGPGPSKRSRLQPSDDPSSSSSTPGPSQSDTASELNLPSTSSKTPGQLQVDTDTESSLPSTSSASCDLVVPEVPEYYRNWTLEDDSRGLWFGNWGLLYECPWCHILYMDYFLYELHMRAHGSDQDPFVCVCGRDCANSSHLFNLHLYLHDHNEHYNP